VLEREDQLLIDLAGSPQPIELVCLPFARSSARDLGA
jgi:hypothetical protein